MSVLVVVADNAEGQAALTAAVAEARLLRTDLVVLHLSLGSFAAAPLELPDGTDLSVTVLERSGPDDRDPVEAVLDEIAERDIARLVLGMRKRTPVGKAVLGSVTQRLLLQSPVPVLTVKIPTRASL